MLSGEDELVLELLISQVEVHFCSLRFFSLHFDTQILFLIFLRFALAVVWSHLSLQVIDIENAKST